MDRAEEIARDYLCNQGVGEVVYEPDGNVPPDFLIEGRIAVEVRRLNQNEETESGWRGLEQIRFALRGQIARLIKTIGPRDTGESWFVFFTFRRPFPPWKRVKQLLRKRLTAFAEQASRTEIEEDLDKGLEIRLLRASNAHPTFFVLWGFVDRDSGGFDLAEMAKNIPICIEEKTRKVSPNRARYQEWWLILVDFIGYGLGSSDQGELKSLVDVPDTWDRIVLVDPETREAFQL